MAFDLAAALQGVSNVPESGTGREQLEYIDIDLIRSDDKNFYSLYGIDELAANIELLGLQQPLRVRTDPENSEGVVIVSGHRRAAALRQLVSEGKDTLRKVPCIREAASGESAELQELRLIYANSDTRRMSPADISKQAERVELLLYKLKEQGVEFPGRMRDHVAEACKVSKSKLARLKVIRENLSEPNFVEAWKAGELAESTAYVIAQQPLERQLAIYEHLIKTRKEKMQYLYQSTVQSYIEVFERLDKRVCKKCHSGKCDNIPNILKDLYTAQGVSYKPCRYSNIQCCRTCSDLGTCKSACPEFADKIKEIKADKKAAEQQEKLAQAERERLAIELASKLLKRFGEARHEAGLSVKDTMTAMGRSYYGSDSAIEKLETLSGVKLDKYTVLDMYGYGTTSETYKPLIKAADALGCSVDYLLCRTDKRNGDAAAQSAQWQNGEPEKPCKAVGRFRIDEKTTLERIVRWDGSKWSFGAGADVACECVGWFPIPEDENEDD